jgi:hypothetical protein
MAQRNIDFGTFPDDPQADAIRTAFTKVQQNFTEVYAGVEGASVASVNRTPGAGITVSSPTGNVIVTANIACVQVHTSTLSIGRDSNGAQDTSITSSSQTLWVDLPATIANVTNINLTGNLNANYVTSNLQLNGNIGSFSGNLTVSNLIANVRVTATGNVSGGNLTTTGALSVTGNANVGNLGTAQVLASANITTPQFISNVATGTAPLTVTSTTRVNNLNVAYANVADNINVVAGSGNNFLIFANAATGNIAEVTSTGLIANLSNNSITATTFVGALSGAATSAGTAGTAGTVTTNAQPNITSTGTLTSMTSSGNVQGANVIATSYTIRSVNAAVSAAGTTQGTGTALTREFNRVSTVASGAGVVLPTAVAGMAIVITNTSANSLLVYPATGAQINALAANVAYTQTTLATLQYVALTATQWYTVGATYA